MGKRHRLIRVGEGHPQLSDAQSSNADSWCCWGSKRSPVCKICSVCGERVTARLARMHRGGAWGHADHWVPDDDANKLLYGKHVRAADILAGKQQPPEGFNVLIDDLMLIENSGLDTSTLLRPVGSGLMRSLPVSHSVRSVHSSRSDE